MRAATIVFLLPVALAGQSSGNDPWTALRAKNPPNLEFQVRMLEPRVHRQRELIRVDVKFPAVQALTPGQPFREQWQFNGFLLDPPASCGTLAKPCLLTHGFRSGIMNGPGSPQNPAILPLNDYIPALQPGHYRVAALARKLMLTNRSAMSSSYGYADPPQYAITDTVAFDIVPSSAGWIAQTMARCVATLKGPQPSSREAYEVRRGAAQQLGLLDDPAAWRASLDVVNTEEGVLLSGLSATSRPSPVCELMQSRIPAPEQSVSSSYLSTLTQICERAHLPPPPATPAASTPAHVQAVISPSPLPSAPAPQLDPELAAYFENLRAYRAGLMDHAATALAASLPRKEAEPKTTAFVTLLEYIRQLAYNQPPAPAPAWTSIVKSEFVHFYPAIEVSRQRYLLELYTSTFHSPDSITLLEAVLDAWKPGDYYEAAHAAFRALSAVDLPRAQARILAELTKPKTWLDTPLLDMLPAGAVPPMDDALIEGLAAAQRPGGWNVQLQMAALAKYATQKALPRIKAIFESQQQPCQPELVAYFVRVDPAYAERVFRSHPWDMQRTPPSCALQYFQRTPPLGMHPVLEKYMAAYLNHRDVYVKTTAARMLGRYGSKDALAALWDVFRYFHEYWKGKGADLAANGEGVQLEVELRNAIARGRNWLATEPDLRTIESLCISERCLAETQNDLRAWQMPLRIEVHAEGGAFNGKVAQYYAIESEAALEAKVAQFPRGTQFVLSEWGTKSDIGAFAVRHGLTITRP